MIKKLVIPIVILAGLSACQKKTNMSEAMIKAQVDSLVELQMKDLNQWAKEDLEQRMTIELRSRTDSIIKARQPKDTVKVPQPDTTRRPFSG